MVDKAKKNANDKTDVSADDAQEQAKETKRREQEEKAKVDRQKTVLEKLAKIFPFDDHKKLDEATKIKLRTGLLKAAERLAFDDDELKAIIFPTKTLNGQVIKETSAQRAQQLIQLSSALRKKFLDADQDERSVAEAGVDLVDWLMFGSSSVKGKPPIEILQHKGGIGILLKKLDIKSR